MARKSALKPKTIIGIDIGTTKITAVVARVDTDSPEILGMAKAPFDASNLTVSDSSVRLVANVLTAVVGEACKEAGCTAQSAVIGISGFTNSCCTAGIVAVKGRISRNDIQRGIAAAAGFKIPNNEILLEQVVESFTIDEVEGIDDPMGMKASRLEVLTHCILAWRDMVDEVTTVCKMAGLTILKATSSELAAAEVLLSKEDKENGVCLLDIGGEHVSLFAYQAGVLKYSASIIWWGGKYLTDSITYLLGVNATKAEKAKLAFSKYGLVGDADEQGLVIRKLLDEKFLALCSHLDTELSKSGLEEELSAGIVLTGGTAELPGLPECIERVLQRPVRRAQFPPDQWLEGVSLEYASAVGLVLRRIRPVGVPKIIS